MIVQLWFFEYEPLILDSKRTLWFLFLILQRNHITEHDLHLWCQIKEWFAQEIISCSLVHNNSLCLTILLLHVVPIVFLWIQNAEPIQILKIDSDFIFEIVITNWWQVTVSKIICLALETEINISLAKLYHQYNIRIKG